MSERSSTNLAAVVLAAALVVLGVGNAAAEDAWRAGPPIPQGANEVIGAAVGDHLLVYGGQDGVSAAMGIFWTLDPKTGQWSTLPSNPVPVHHAAAAGVGHKLYLFGGFRLPTTGKTGWYPVSNAWAFDSDTRSWSALPDMPTPRGALAAVAVGTKIYVVGGARIPQGTDMPDGLYGGGPTELLGTNEVFDTVTNSWTTLRPMPTPRNHHALAAIDGKVYAIGGRVGSCFSAGWSSNVAVNEAYDLAADRWTARAPMPTARSGIAIAVVGGKAHVLGGEGWIEDFGGVFRTHEAYDAAQNKWLRLTRMPTPRHGFAAATLDGKIYAVSGVNNAGGAGTLSVVNVTEIYEP
jgi:N-acetylneuraminic acid mutarotase